MLHGITELHYVFRLSQSHQLKATIFIRTRYCKKELSEIDYIS